LLRYRARDKAERIPSWFRIAPACRSALLGTLVVCLATEAGADSEPIRIEYRADAGCPTRADFEERVFDRTASARLAADGEAARTFSVDLRRQQRRVTGRLVIREPNGATMTRRVSGSDCGDVATVLALATALAIDPRAELAPHETLEEESPNSPDTSGGRGPVQPTEPTGDTESESPAVAPSESQVATGDLQPYAALGGRVRVFVAPQPAWGASAAIGAFSGHDDAASDFFLELSYLATAPERVQGATATFRFAVARPGVCPVSARFGSLRVAPCIAAELGAVTARGEDIPLATASTRFFGAAELFVRADLTLSRVFFLSVDAGVNAPFTRYEFLFQDPDTEIHRIPPLTASGGIRVGVRL
jgi:hypothetical protein